MSKARLAGLLVMFSIPACGGSITVEVHPGADAGPATEDAGPMPADAGSPPPDAGASSDAGQDGGICVDTPEVLPDGQVGASNCGCQTEAVMYVQQIAAAAAAAYQAKGFLCDSVPTWIPTTPPPHKKYQPAHSVGVDFHTGNDSMGWTCLGFEIDTPIHCSYRYARSKGGFIGPKVGGPDPGPLGFEVAAQGDADVDGIFSTYTIAGTVDPSTGKLTLSPVFEHSPLD